MEDIMKTLFNDASTGVIPESDHNNHIITEAVILDMLNGNKESLTKVYSSVGKYAVRDNLLEDAQLIDAPEKSLTCDDSHADRAAILAIAKEANDPDYDLYCKAFCLMKDLMYTLKNKYCDKANCRVADCTKVVEANPRIINAVEACK